LKIWRVDFTRAFRQTKEAKAPKEVRCDRQLLEKLKALDASALTKKPSITSPKDEVKGSDGAADNIVGSSRKMIAEKVRTKCCTDFYYKSLLFLVPGLVFDYKSRFLAGDPVKRREKQC